jgi:LemA protein
MTVLIIVIVGLVLLLGLIYILIRNSIIGSRNRVDEAWSGIDVQLKRRHDLVPNLVETVKGYAQHEQRVFEATTQARADAMRAESVDATRAAEQNLTAALANLRAVAENYPDLRATENFQRLQADLNEIEDEIQASRRIYNSNVQSYNTKIQIFPNSIVANQGGFTAREFFEIETAAEREPVQVSFTQPAGGQAPAGGTPPAGGQATAPPAGGGTPPQA